MKEKIIKFLKKHISEDLDFEKLIEAPKIPEHGDFSFPCFLLAKSQKKAPPQISKELEEILHKDKPNFISKIVAMGPFLNFYVDSTIIVKQVLTNIEKGINSKVLNPKKILIEYPSPNTNKNLHIGHVRNILLGNSIIKILEKTGNDVIKTSINNDRGIAICKAMLGYKLYFKEKTPNQLNLKPDEFIANCYVEFEKNMQKDKSLEEQAQQMLVKWEANDKYTRDLWKETLNYVYEGYKITFNNLKLTNFDKQYYESEIYDKGKEIVENALKNKIKGFKKDKETGAVYFDFENETYGQKYLLRGDGTTLYMTQDIYLAQLKHDEFNADKYIFIVGKEQQYHFEVLFQILEKLNLGGSDKNYHYAYGYVYNKEGKKFSSRKGEVLGADWLLNQTKSKAKENLLNKELTKNLKEVELNKRAEIIGYSALAFSMLNINPMSDIKFDIEKALDFVGETGPYVQYTYARIQSIIKKFNQKLDLNTIDYENYSIDEINLIKKLGEFSQTIQSASEKLKPSIISNYLIRISQTFNEFYQNTKILSGDENKIIPRLILCRSTAKIIKEGLELLGIETLDEM